MLDIHFRDSLQNLCVHSFLITSIYITSFRTHFLCYRFLILFLMLNDCPFLWKMLNTSPILNFSTASTERFPAVPDIELQCRVVKRWPTLSTLVVDIVPWCLLVNNTSSDLYIKDLDRDVVLYIPKLDVVAPHRLQVRQS